MHLVVGDVPVERCCAFSGKRCSRRQRGACGDIVNLEDLPARSSKVLIGIDLHTCVHRDVSV